MSVVVKACRDSSRLTPRTVAALVNERSDMSRRHSNENSPSKIPTVDCSFGANLNAAS